MKTYREISKSVSDSRSGFGHLVERSFTGIQDPAAMAGGMTSMFQGDRTSRESRMAFEHFKSWVYVCVNYLAKRVATQPFMVGEALEATESGRRGSQYRIKNSQLMPALKSQLSVSDVEILETHPIIDVFQRPNYLQGQFEFFYLSCVNLLITGESYWIIGDVNVDGETQLEAWAVPTHWVIPDHRKGPYTAFRFKPPGTAGNGEPLEPESVVRTYLPDPSSLTSVMSPLHAIQQAARIDNSILFSQDQMFKRGINPNVIITMAQKRGPDGKGTGARPKLNNRARRQILQSVRSVWGNTLNHGDPAIVDGMIEGIHKLQAMPAEMDWMNSSTMNKSRVFQAFGVNPIVVGEIIGANRAQATEAERSVCENTINPLINAFSTTISERICPLYESSSKCVAWIQESEPIDVELQDKRWLEGMKQGIIDADEIRAKLYNLPPRTDISKNALLTSHTGWSQAVATITAYQAGQIPRESAKQLLILYLEIEDSLAEILVGDKPEAPEPAVVPALPAPGAGEEEGELEDAGERPEPVPGDGDGDGIFNESSAEVSAFKSAMIDTLEAFEQETLSRVRACLGGKN